MQFTGYLKIKNKKILVLVRQRRYGRCLKIRKSGRDGVFLSDESDFLADRPDLLTRLKDGETICC